MRVLDPKALATARSPVCEYCRFRCGVERHHIISCGMASANRLDLPLNLIDLGNDFACGCHRLAQQGKLADGHIATKRVLWIVVGIREGHEPERIERALNAVLRADKGSDHEAIIASHLTERVADDVGERMR